MTSREENSRITKAEQALFEEFIKDLEQTAAQVQLLLTEIRDSKIDAATIKAELKFLVDNVKQLSNIIREGGESGSVLTRLALLEQSMKDVKKYMMKDAAADTELGMRLALLEQKLEVVCFNKPTPKPKPNGEGKWKLYIVIASGILTIVGSIIAAML